MVKALKPPRPIRPSTKKADSTFVEFIVNDQLADLEVDARRMFSGHGLYSKSKFFGIIADGSVYFRTGEATRPKFVAPGSGPFMPSARQKLKNYYAVPVDVLEDSRELTEWARKALCVELEK